MEQEAAYLYSFVLFGEANPNVHIPLSREIEAFTYNSFNEYCQESVIGRNYPDPFYCLKENPGKYLKIIKPIVARIWEACRGSNPSCAVAHPMTHENIGFSRELRRPRRHMPPRRRRSQGYFRSRSTNL
jgi:hypothetical protein